MTKLEASNKIKSLTEVVKNWFNSLNQTEKWGTIIAAIAVSIWLSSLIYEPTVAKFKKQEKALTAQKQRLQSLPELLERNIRLNQKKLKAEKSLKGVEFNQGGLAHIESLIKSKAKVDKDKFSITTKSVRKVNQRYERIPFDVRIEITDYKNLVDFLDELVRGSKPMILNRIRLTKSTRNNQLMADLEVSALKRL